MCKNNYWICAECGEAGANCGSMRHPCCPKCFKRVYDGDHDKYMMRLMDTHDGISLIPKTYSVAMRPMQKLLRKWKWLKYFPIFRRYAEGGDLSTPERAAETQAKWEAELKMRRAERLFRKEHK